LFDHIVLRDDKYRSQLHTIVGDRNVDYLGDLSWILTQGKKSHKRNKNLRFGICLDQTKFYNNLNESKLVYSICQNIQDILIEYPTCSINLIPFNTSDNDEYSDYVINDKVYDCLKRILKSNKLRNISCIIEDGVKDSDDMIRFFGRHDLIIGMKYHSEIFSKMECVPYVDLKIDNVDTLFTSVQNALAENISSQIIDKDEFNTIKNIINNRKRKQLLTSQYNIGNIIKDFHIFSHRCETLIMSYMNCDASTYEKLRDIKVQTLLKETDTNGLELLSILNFAITNNVAGAQFADVKRLLSEDKNRNLTVSEVIKLIFETYNVSTIDYCPEFHGDKKLIVNMNYINQDNYSRDHRCGWSYVVQGLENLDTLNNNKPANILLDTCVDRTFMWGSNIMKNAKIIPYESPWIGFIHHTFYKGNNTILESQEFQESLKHCKCLITFSSYLKEQLQKDLKNIKVINLIHPTEIVGNVFTMDKFKANSEKKIVQIGGWLRNINSISELELPKNNNLDIQKAVLENFHDKCVTNDLCTSGGGNEYDGSVEIINHLNNKDYDKLLSQNLVFLDLYDTSVNNTVIECIVRNTPLIINRHPALIELLGKEYPGFYDNLKDAGSKIHIKKIVEIYTYLKKIDKTPFALDYFLNSFQDSIYGIIHNDLF
jgi:hypothetical protein